MEEKRRHRRLDLESKLMIKRLDGDHENEDDVTIEILDVSKTGVGFCCDKILEIGAVYEGFLVIWTKEVLHAFMEIVRISKQPDGLYEYGAIFVGMPEMDNVRISVYDAFQAANDTKIDE